MSVETPSECDSAIFNATCWIGDATLTGNYVEFPVAQGNNTLLDLTVDNIAVTDSVDIDGGLIVTGESTLVAGVLTDDINSIDVSSNLDIVTLQTSGILNIGNNSVRSGEINIGSVSSQAFNINIGNATNGAITVGGLNAEFQILSQGFSLSSSSGLTSDVLFPVALNAGLSLGGAGTAGQVFTSQATASPIWSTIVAPSTYGTAGQLLTSNATSVPTWENAPVSINYKTDTITPGATATSGSYLFTTVGGTPFTATPKITLTGFVSVGTTIVVVGVSAKSNLGFSWLASSTGLSGIDYIAVQS